MSKHAFMAAFGVALVVLAAAVVQVELVNANPINLPPMPPITLTVYTPENGSTYYGGSVSYEFLTQMDSWNGAGTLNQGVNVLLDGNIVYNYYEIGAYRKGALTELTNGLHYLEVRASSYSWAWKPYQSTASSGKIYFTVNGSNVKNPLEDIKVVSATIHPNSASFNFTTKEPASWLGYSLDQEDTVAITEDVRITNWYGLNNYFYNITGIEAGTHNVTFYARDASGNAGQTTQYPFTIEEPTPTTTNPPTSTPQPAPSPTQEPTLEPTQTPTPASDGGKPLDWAPVILAALVVVTAAGVLVYFWKRKRD